MSDNELENKILELYKLYISGEIKIKEICQMTGKNKLFVASIAKKHNIYYKKPKQKPNIIEGILISQEEFDKLHHSNLVPICCSCCGKIANKTKHNLQISLRINTKKLYCSRKCFDNRPILNPPRRSTKKVVLIPPKEELESLINKDFSIAEIGKHFGVSTSKASRWLKTYKLNTTLRKNGIGSHPKTKEKISNGIKKYVLNHTNEFLKYSSKGNILSIPCEHVKKQLRERNIVFSEEVMPLLHIGRLYKADILFEQYKAILEINGSQHYNNKEKLILAKKYQERHDLLVKNGWRVFEIPSENAMKYDFLDKILPIIYDVTVYSDEYLVSYQKNFPIRKEVLHWYLWNYSVYKISKIFNISEWRIHEMIKLYDISAPSNKYRGLYTYKKIIDYQI